MKFSFFQSGQFAEDMIPTVGFNMRKITKGNVTIKVSIVVYHLPYWDSYGVSFSYGISEVSHDFARCGNVIVAG